MTERAGPRIEGISDAVAASGFPLQSAVARLIRTTYPYELVHEEYPWANGAGVAQFLDIIARHGSAVFPIECKKTETQSWVFLLPDEDADMNGVHRFRAVFTKQIADSTRRVELYCGDWTLEPASDEAMFCVVSARSRSGSERRIEPDVQLLLGATDDYAIAVRRGFKPGRMDELDTPYVPILVTTAPLYVAQYNSQDIPLESGRLELKPSAVREVPWVRFRKTFVAGVPREVGERTIMVVTACRLADFLVSLKIPLPQYPQNSVHIPVL